VTYVIGPPTCVAFALPVGIDDVCPVSS
jgi:hypothetical protein